MKLEDIKVELTLNPTIKIKSDVDNIRKIPLSLKGNLKIIKKSDDDIRRIIAGYANIAVVDSENQLIPTEVLKAGIQSLLDDSTYANLMLSHRNIQIGKIIESYGDLKTHVDDKGLFIVAEVRSDIETANEVWEKILNNEINGFSIGCEVIDNHDKCDVDGNCIEVLDKINIYEVSVCNFPVNEMSGFVVVSKSKYDEELDLTNYSNVCDECGINNDNMKKKKVKSENTKEKEEETEDTSETESDEITEETSTEEKDEFNLKEWVERMERTMENIEAVLSKLNPVEDDKEKEEESEPETEPEKETKEVPEPKDIEDETKKPVEKETEDKSIEILAEILKGIEEIKESIKSNDKVDELKMAVKSRDDQLAALKMKTKVAEKAKEKEEEEVIQKTLQESQDNVDELIDEDECPYIFDRGTIVKKRFM